MDPFIDTCSGGSRIYLRGLVKVSLSSLSGRGGGDEKERTFHNTDYEVSSGVLQQEVNFFFQNIFYPSQQISNDLPLTALYTSQH